MLRATPTVREMARMDMPSTRQPMIWARFSVESLFILNIMLDNLTLVKTVD